MLQHAQMSLEYLFTVWIALWTQVKTTWTCMWWWLVLSIFELMRSFHVASHYFSACMNFAFSSIISEKSIWPSKQEALFVACSIQAYLPCRQRLSSDLISVFIQVITQVTQPGTLGASNIRLLLSLRRWPAFRGAFVPPDCSQTKETECQSSVRLSSALFTTR